MSGAIELGVLGVGLLGPGLPSWDEALPVLRGDTPYVPAPSVGPPPQRLVPRTQARTQQPDSQHAKFDRTAHGAPSTRLALEPPKPKELVSTWRTGCERFACR